MHLRPPQEKDIPRLIYLIQTLGYPIKEKTLQKNLESYRSSIFIAESNEEVVGLLAYHILPLFHSNEKQMRIVSLAVDPLFQRKGIGKALLQEAEKRAKKLGCSAIELTSAAHREKTGAHLFYKAQGFSSNTDKSYFRKNI